jgi:hypothetical protein
VSRAGLLGVAAISAAVLAYQVLLVRLLSIVSWHHFAYMIISIALLGFGASGTALALAQGRLVPRFKSAFAAAATLFALTAVGSFALVVRLPFNPLALVWDASQLVWLNLAYALLVLPFFFGGGAIGLTFTRFPREIGRLYAYDLVGAGLGALGVVGVLFIVTPSTTLRLVAALGLLSAALVILPPRDRGAWAAASALGGARVAVALWLPPTLTAIHPHISQFKGLAMALQAPDARILEERSSPLGLSASSRARRSPSATHPACRSTTSSSRRHRSASSPTPSRSAPSPGSRAIWRRWATSISRPPPCRITCLKILMC